MEQDIDRLRSVSGTAEFDYREFPQKDDETPRAGASSAPEQAERAPVTPAHKRDAQSSPHTPPPTAVTPDPKCGPRPPFGASVGATSLLSRFSAPKAALEDSAPRHVGWFMITQSGGVGATTLASAAALAMERSGWPTLVADTESAGMMPYCLGGAHGPDGPMGSRLCGGLSASALAFRQIDCEEAPMFMDSWYETESWKPSGEERHWGKIAVVRGPSGPALNAMMRSGWPCVVVVRPTVGGLAYVDWLESQSDERSGMRLCYAIGMMEERDDIERKAFRILRDRLGSRLLLPVIPYDRNAEKAIAEGAHVMTRYPDSDTARALESLSKVMVSLSASILRNRDKRE